jgi:hypothetical protein
MCCHPKLWRHDKEVRQRKSRTTLNTINQPTRYIVSVRILTLISKVDVHNVKLIQLPVNQILSTTTLRRVWRYQRVNQNRRRTDNTILKLYLCLFFRCWMSQSSMYAWWNMYRRSNVWSYLSLSSWLHWITLWNRYSRTCLKEHLFTTIHCL